MRGRIRAALLALALCVQLVPCARAADVLAEYSDLDKNAWYAPGVRYCLERGLMTGYGSRVRYFSPWQQFTRAQLATILWRMEGEPKIGLTMQYTDVPEDMWYTEAVRWIVGVEVMSGYTVLSFGPEDPITREQFAAILWRYAKYRDGDIQTPDSAAYDSYGDRGAVSDYAEDAMRWACALGIITGQKDRFGNVWLIPQGNCSRAVAATILMRFCLDMGND